MAFEQEKNQQHDRNVKSQSNEISENFTPLQAILTPPPFNPTIGSELNYPKNDSPSSPNKPIQLFSNFRRDSSVRRVLTNYSRLVDAVYSAGHECMPELAETLVWEDVFPERIVDRSFRSGFTPIRYL